MLAPRGPNAAEIAGAWWVMFWGAVLVLAVVMTLVLLAVRPRRSARAPSANVLIAGGGLAFPIVALTALLLYGFNMDTAPQGNEQSLIIEVTGHRWWWEVRYPGAAPVVTANEIHLPVGRPVELRLRSADVIHSFWVPQLGGKQDMIPGHLKTLRLQADAPGAYRGQCAEFCGRQHAHMALWVYALPVDEFEAWRTARATPSVTRLDSAAQRGRDRFLAERCVECHSVRGTTARGEVGPDLTHVGSRRFLGAGTLRNDPGAIAQWIAGHQRLKPGNRMERFDHLAPADIQDIAGWLEQLR
jgi:cytochrome c oxidase subunit 2